MRAGEMVLHIAIVFVLALLGVYILKVTPLGAQLFDWTGSGRIVQAFS